MGKLDLLGKRFGRLVVVAEAGRTKYGNVIWECGCDCGRISIIETSNLSSGDTKSCGCLQRESRVTHGLSKTPAYNSWIDMNQRCMNHKDTSFKHYGGRGIQICKEWLNFEAFFADMGERPAGMTIDRINNDGNYEPGNCRWATRTQQNRNTRIHKKSKTGVPGVTIHKKNRRFRAGIYVNNKYIHLGYFVSLKGAKAARIAGEKQYWTE